MPTPIAYNGSATPPEPKIRRSPQWTTGTLFSVTVGVAGGATYSTGAAIVASLWSYTNQHGDTAPL